MCREGITSLLMETTIFWIKPVRGGGGHSARISGQNKILERSHPDFLSGICVSELIAPVAQLVTSLPSDTLGREFESR